MAAGVIPLGKIVYVCDDIVQDLSTGKITILGSFTSIRMGPETTYPLRRDKICVFAQLTGGYGPATIQARVVDASTGDDTFTSQVYPLHLPGGNIYITVLIRILNCPFRHPGVYFVQLYCRDVFIVDRRLIVS